MEAQQNVVPFPGVIPEGMARLNVTFSGSNGDLAEPVAFDLADVDVRRIAAEAIAAGSIPGIARVMGLDLVDFVVDRFGPTEGLPARLMIRPKVPFGA